MSGDTVMTYNARYVDLLKRILRNSVYGQEAITTDSDVADCRAAIDGIRQRKPWVLEKYSDLTGESLARVLAYTKRARNLHTYVREPGLDNIEACARDIIASEVPGDFVDAGTLRGGTAILMRGILEGYGDKTRKVIVADSFQGLPPPSGQDSVFDREVWFALADELPQYNLRCDETQETVRGNFAAYGLLDSQVVFLPGWFRDTLRTLTPSAIALLRIDADWYEGTRDALQALYPLIPAGGYVIVDDYKLDGCKRAVDEYRIKHRVFEKILTADEEDGVIYWKKGAVS